MIPQLKNFLSAMDTLTIPVTIIKDDNSWSCWTSEQAKGIIHTYGTGATPDEAINDYVEGLKEISECIYEDRPEINYDEILPQALMKILLTPKEELKNCLDGKIYEDF